MKKKNKVLSILIVCVIFCLSLCGCNRVNISKYENAKDYKTGNFSYSASNVKKVEINWVAGKVDIVQSDNETLSVYENGDKLDDDQKLHYLLDDSTLIIQYAESGYRGNIKEEYKNLVIEIPKNILLDIDTVSANVTAGELTLTNLNIESVSANIKADSLVCDSVDIEIVSGNTEIKYVQCSKIGFESVSGNLSITFPEDGATVKLNSVSGELKTLKEYTKENDKYIFGEGKCEIEAEVVSGDIFIK